MTARPVLLSDLPLIRQHLTRIDRSAHKAWMQFATPDSTLDGIRALAEQQGAWIVDERYLVLVDAGSPWYNSGVTVLEELMVLALVPGGDFRKVTEFLDQVAAARGCDFISSGTALATSDRALSRLYMRAGYDVAGTMLTKLLQGDPNGKGCQEDHQADHQGHRS